MKKLKALKEFVNNMGEDGICIAFSGGVDSSLVLKIAIDTGKKVHAVMFRTNLHPAADEPEARKIAKEMGADITVMEIDEFSNPDILKNPVNRCYLCKKMLFTKLAEFAKDNGYKVIMDGTNADDHNEYRPGIKALEEIGVVSPLAELGITKDEVREYAKMLGISVHNKPSAPCMATRFPYNTDITKESLDKVEAAENYLKECGLHLCRLRVHFDIARIEVREEDFEKILINRKSIVKELKDIGFTYITLDIEGFRSGSMDVGFK